MKRVSLFHMAVCGNLVHLPNGKICLYLSPHESVWDSGSLFLLLLTPAWSNYVVVDVTNPYATM